MRNHEGWSERWSERMTQRFASDHGQKYIVYDLIDFYSFPPTNPPFLPQPKSEQSSRGRLFEYKRQLACYAAQTGYLKEMQRSTQAMASYDIVWCQPLTNT